MKDWLIKLFVVSLAILAPIHSMMVASLVLIIIDLILGIWAAIKRKDKITSAALRRTISKILVYQLAIITGFVCETYLLNGILPVSKLVGGIVGLVEATSILENLNLINGEPIFKKLISKLGSENDNLDKK